MNFNFNCFKDFIISKKLSFTNLNLHEDFFHPPHVRTNFYYFIINYLIIYLLQQNDFKNKNFFLTLIIVETVSQFKFFISILIHLKFGNFCLTFLAIYYQFHSLIDLTFPFLRFCHKFFNKID